MGTIDSSPEFARLVVVGPGPLRPRCQRRCRELGIEESVTFEGPVPSDRLPGYYCGSSVYVSPAVGRESMGIVLVEAMACGRAVVASDIPGYNEVIQHDTNGLLVPQRNPVSLSQAVVSVLENKRTRERLELGALARADDFAWTRIAA